MASSCTAFALAEIAMRASAWGRTREWHSSATTTLGACEVASCYTGAVVFTAGKQVTGTPVNVLVGSRRTFLLYRDGTTEIILTTIGSDEGSKQAIGLGEARIREAQIEV